MDRNDQILEKLEQIEQLSNKNSNDIQNLIISIEQIAKAVDTLVSQKNENIGPNQHQVEQNHKPNPRQVVPKEEHKEQIKRPQTAKPKPTHDNQPKLYVNQPQECQNIDYTKFEELAESFKTIKIKDIQQIKAFVSPPPAVKQVMEMIGLLLQVKKPSEWKEIIKIMADPNTFITQLKNYDKEHQQSISVQQVEKLMEEHQFTQEILAKKLSCLPSLYSWVQAMVLFHKIQKGNNQEEEEHKDDAQISDEIVYKKVNDAQKVVQKAEPQFDLEVAIDYESELKKINKNMINELKSFAKPPSAVLTIMEIINFILTNQKSSDWKELKKILANPQGFLESILNFDMDRVDFRKVKLIQKALVDSHLHEGNQSIDKVRGSSVVLPPCLGWIYSVIKHGYGKNKQIVQEKQEEQKQQTQGEQKQPEALDSKKDEQIQSDAEKQDQQSLQEDSQKPEQAEDEAQEQEKQIESEVEPQQQEIQE